LIARDFAKQGAKAIAIHFNSESTKAEADSTVAAIKAMGTDAAAFQADLTTAGAVEKLFADVIAAFGQPDIAINTVGKVLKKPIIEISENEYDEMSAVNAKSAFFFIEDGWQDAQRQWQNLHARHITVGCLYSVLCELCWHEVARRAFYTCCLKGVRRALNLCDGNRARPNGYSLLLSG